ncbi:hypothetical protein LCGC14_2646540, partial [marine sediment metagenome]
PRVTTLHNMAYGSLAALDFDGYS